LRFLPLAGAGGYKLRIISDFLRQKREEIMLPARCTSIWIVVVVVVGSLGLATAQADDETARFNGTWKADFPSNGQTITIASVHADNDYWNYALLPNGSYYVGSGTFTAANGKWAFISALGNDSGTYQFSDDNTVTCKNDAGASSVWKRDDAALPLVIGAPANSLPPNQIPQADPSPQARAQIEAKMAAKDYESALILLGQLKAQSSPNPFLCANGARVMMQMENYFSARGMTAFFLQHTFDNADAYVVHAQASAALGFLGCAQRDLQIAAQLRPETADADRKSVDFYAALQPSGFAPDQIVAGRDELVKMAAAHQPFDALVNQAVRIIKGENDICRCEGDDYRERRRQRVAAALAEPHKVQPLADLASFLFNESSNIHGDGVAAYGIAPYRWSEPTLERQLAAAYADCALKNDPNNVQAMSAKAGALMAMGQEDKAQSIVVVALQNNPADPELLHMFCQLMSRSSGKHTDVADQISQPMTWEDDNYFYIQSRSPEELAQARALYATANEESDRAEDAIAAAIRNTQGTAAGFYYQAVQCHRKEDNAGGAALMEKAVQLEPDNPEYHDFLAYFCSNLGWRRETEFLTQWSLADNVRQTSAAKMARLAYNQLRRGEYDSARESIGEALRIDPSDPRGPAWMGCLIAGEHRDRAHADEAANWMEAAAALEAAKLRLGGLKHLTPIQYPSDITEKELGLAHATGQQLMAAHRPQEALAIVRSTIDDANRVGRPFWNYPLPGAMLPLSSLQGTPVPHMNPLKAPPVFTTTIWMINLHQLAGDALKEMGQRDEASKEYDAANELQQSMEQQQRNAPPPPRRM